MLSKKQRDGIEIVLASPRNPLNIGAVARAMANFGFARLTVVTPYGPHWREARSAVGATELLHSARDVESLSEAIADCAFVIGTGSLARRKPEQPIIALPDLAPQIHKELSLGNRVAVVFGSEKRGLTREDFGHCHAVTEIPTEPSQPSMNLGQAVAVCLYEIATRIEEEPRQNAIADSGLGALSSASTRNLELLAGVIEETMVAANYSPAAMRKANRHDLDLLLRRLDLNDRDATRILGFFRRIVWRLNR